jgi:putative hydrolase of the HAD superfamily
MTKSGGHVKRFQTAEIKTVFLDAGGVLLTPNWRRVVDTLATRGMNVDMKVLASSELRVRFELDSRSSAPKWKAGQGDWRFLDLVLSRAGVPTSNERASAVRELKKYHADQNLWEVVPPEIPPTLRRLRQLALKLVVVSNSNGTVRAALGRVGLNSQVDFIVDSHEEGVAKPDPRLFRIALARAQARPESTIHVGDMFCVDVLGARAAGLRAMLLDSSGLYASYDCPKVSSLQELADRIETNDLI